MSQTAVFHSCGWSHRFLGIFQYYWELMCPVQCQWVAKLEPLGSEVNALGHWPTYVTLYDVLTFILFNLIV